MSEDAPAGPLPPPHPPQLAQKPARAIAPGATRHQARSIEHPNLARPSLRPASSDGD